MEEISILSHIKVFFTGVVFPVILGLIIAFILRTFVFQFNTVSGQSMLPTFQDKDYLVTEKISTYFENYQQGDIVIVDTKDDKFIIKRIIGVPGDTIEFIPSEYYGNNQRSYISVNGEALTEDYIYEEMRIDKYQKETVEDHQYFVMGDNRNHSADSRWYGAFDKENIIGVVVLELKNDVKFH